MKLFKCKKCGQIVMKVEEKPCGIFCCGEEMEEMIPNSTDASAEKHIPVYEVKDSRVYVKVGAEEHVMTPEHHIAWILLKTNRGIMLRKLDLDKGPTMVFTMCEKEEVEEVYEYCNLHGLWKA